jgi:DNA-binding transcriptional ArsR family regulator
MNILSEALYLTQDISHERHQAALLARRLRALANPVRLRALRILFAAAEQTVSVNRLTELLATVAQSRVSVHIKALVRAGFLEGAYSSIRGTTERFYHVNLRAIQEALSEILCYIGARAS